MSATSGQFSDVLLYYRQDRPPFKGHSLILTLSPTLGALLNPNAQRQPQEIFLSLTEHPEITDGESRGAFLWMRQSLHSGMTSR